MAFNMKQVFLLGTLFVALGLFQCFVDGAGFEFRAGEGL